MKILITSEWYKPVVNGVVRSMLTLVKELKAMGHDVRVLTMSPMMRSYKSDDVYYLASVNMNKFYPQARQAGIVGIPLIRELIQWKPDVVHSQTEFASFLYAKFIVKSTKAAHVHTYHTIYEDYTHYFSPSKRLGKIEIAFFSRGVLSGLDEVITPTNKTKKILKKYRVETPISVVPTGLELHKFKHKMKVNERRAMRKSLGIKEDEWVALFLGRLAKEKNFEEVFRLLKNTDTRFVLVGDGPYRDRLQKIVREMNIETKVIFTGMVLPDEVINYYQMADCFISASTSETQGLTYIEALASGLPVIAKDDPCLKGVVYDGVNGFIYEDDKDFKKKFKKMKHSGELMNEMSKSARRMVRLKFSSEKFAESILNVYKSAVITRNKKHLKRKH